MNRLLLLTLTIPLLFASSSGQAQELREVKLTVTPAARPQPAMRYRLFPITRELKEGNAAALYYRGILQFSETARANAAQQISDQERASELLEIEADKFPRDEARKLVDKYRSALHEISIGTHRVRAVWDIPLREDGVATILREVQETRGIARVLALKARLAGLEGRFAEAVESIETMLVLARHVSESGTLVSSLVGAAIISVAADQIEFLSCLPDAPNLYWALTALPEPIIEMRSSIESEQFWLEGSLPYLDLLDRTTLSTEQAAELAAALGKLLAESADGPPAIAREFSLGQASAALQSVLVSYPECKRQLIEAGMSAARVEAMPAVQVVALRWVQTYRELLDEEVAFTDRPHPEARRAFELLDQKRESAVGKPESLLADILLPSVTAAQGAFTRVSQRMALLRIIQAVRLYAAAHDGKLPAKLADIDSVPIPLDPVSGEAFSYKVEGNSAILKPAPFHIQLRYELTVSR